MYRHMCVLRVCDNTVGRMQHVQVNKDISAYAKEHNLWAYSGQGYATSAALSLDLCACVSINVEKNLHIYAILSSAKCDASDFLIPPFTVACQSARLQFPLSHLFVFHFCNHFAYSHCSTQFFFLLCYLTSAGFIIPLPSAERPLEGA